MACAMTLRGKEGIMALRHRIEYLRKEHEALLNLASRIETLLESVSKNDFSEHVKGLTELRSLERGLAGIVEHCHAEDRIIESTYHHYLQPQERTRIDTEHEDIVRLVSNFQEELKFATTDRTMAMIVPGMDVVKRLRAHVTYERELLNRIARSGEKQQRAVRGKKLIKGGHEKTRKHIAKPKTDANETHFVPYTVEPHPEL
jgi:hypothetical protein